VFDEGSHIRYLKWQNDLIGTIAANGSVAFTEPDYNTVVRIYTRGQQHWTSDEFAAFLAERVISRDRRDIEHILFRLDLSEYDVMSIAYALRAMHPKDLIWIADTPNQRYDEAMTSVFASVFKSHLDLIGDSVDSPEGYNIKRYGVYQGKYGIYKQRISPLTTDVESEVAVFLLAKRLGIGCCPAYQTDRDTVFSEFLYDYSQEYIVHFRRLFSGTRSLDEYANLLAVRPQYQRQIQQMILIDFITRQDDRHLSNIAVKVTGDDESFYPLFDNGRSLFYEDTPELVEKAVGSPVLYATNFGPSGTYYDYVQEIARQTDLSTLIDLSITTSDVAAILQQANFKNYRFEGALSWITNTLDIIRQVAAGKTPVS
jgi:hypothetical protein